MTETWGLDWEPKSSPLPWTPDLLLPLLRFCSLIHSSQQSKVILYAFPFPPLPSPFPPLSFPFSVGLQACSPTELHPQNDLSACFWNSLPDLQPSLSSLTFIPLRGPGKRPDFSPQVTDETVAVTRGWVTHPRQPSIRGPQTWLTLTLLLAPLCTVFPGLPTAGLGGICQDTSSCSTVVQQLTGRCQTCGGYRQCQKGPGSRLLLPGSPGKPSLYLALVVNNSPGFC